VSALLGAWLAISLVLYAGAHVALVVGLFRREPRWRGAVALVVPPLAPYWGWPLGMRARAWLWLGALGAYALGVALSPSS
jgi:hypothetical protein